MDSPIRKQQKRNDYLRHKLFRKINRRRKAEKELALKAPEKELKRRLKRPRYDDGKNVVYEIQNTEDGTIYRVKPSAFGSEELNVTTPEVVVTTRDPRKPVPTTNYLNSSNIKDSAKETIKNALLSYAFGDNPKQVILRRLYDNISPYSYTSALYRVHNAVVNNKREKYKDYTGDLRDDIFAEYLQIPKEQRHNTGLNYWKLNPAKYKPSLSKNNADYFSLSLPKEVIEDLYNDVYFGTNVRNSDGLSLNENTVSETIDPLGRHTIGRGYDSEGEYMSYYDSWDLTPYGRSFKDQSLGIGKPVNIYDRIYLDDYFGMPKEYRGSVYIPELTVTANKYSNGKEELPYPLRTSTDYDDNLAYQRGILRDPKTGHMWSTTQEEYPKERIYLKKPNHPTYSKAIWGDMTGGYDVYRKGDRDYAAPTFSELMYTKPPFRYDSGKDSGIHINPKNRGKFNALKKRTGKTTEQLTHSKNPLTRKRAIFALNAAKWRKK